ncbi:MAG: glycoside hydrolase family 99-like domain-containing protein [Rhizobiaceae bacterium]
MQPDTHDSGKRSNDHDPAFAALSGANLIDPDAAVLRDSAKLIAFYLPQYHVVPENSEWWGEGFTEWTNVRRAKPNFEGHDQPKIPRELGCYDLSDVSVMAVQAELAKLYGIHGFCFYHYWFSGRRILEKPVEQFLASDIEMPFCLCWANENWTRTWDGDTQSVLLEQKYLPSDASALIDSLMPAFRDRRYIMLNGKPLLLVYRAKQIPHSKTWFAAWRRAAKTAGFPGLHIAVVDMHDVSTPDEVGADALVEFPPHKFGGPQSAPATAPTLTNSEFSGSFVDYRKIIAQSALKPPPPYPYYRGIIPSWDNTARRQNTGTTVIDARPDLYGIWLRYLRTYARQHDGDGLIFINAWNEWGEGCTLEPDERWGLGYLEETLRSAFRTAEEPRSVETARTRLFETVARLSAGDHGASVDHREIERVAAELSAYKPQSGFVQSMSERLRRWPLAHSAVRALYRVATRLKT